MKKKNAWKHKTESSENKNFEYYPPLKKISNGKYLVQEAKAYMGSISPDANTHLISLKFNFKEVLVAFTRQNTAWFFFCTNTEQLS